MTTNTTTNPVAAIGAAAMILTHLDAVPGQPSTVGRTLAQFQGADARLFADHVLLDLVIAGIVRRDDERPATFIRPSARGKFLARVQVRS